MAAGARHRLDHAADDAGVLGGEVAALEGGGGGGHGGELASQVELGVGGAGGDVEGVAEPGGAVEAHGVEAVGVTVGGLLEGGDGAVDGGVDAVGLDEGGLEDVGQLDGAEALAGGAAEDVDELLGRRVDEPGELHGTHVRSLPLLEAAANPTC